MAVSDSFLTFVLEQLDLLREVSSRRMFGGVGLYSGETFFGVIDNDTLFFKVDAATSPRYVAEGMPPFQPIPGQAPMKSYYQVPPAVLEDADAILEWATEAVEVSRRGGGRPRRRRAPSSAARTRGRRRRPGRRA